MVAFNNQLALNHLNSAILKVFTIQPSTFSFNFKSRQKFFRLDPFQFSVVIRSQVRLSHHCHFIIMHVEREIRPFTITLLQQTNGFEFYTKLINTNTGNSRFRIFSINNKVRRQTPNQWKFFFNCRAKGKQCSAIYIMKNYRNSMFNWFSHALIITEIRLTIMRLNWRIKATLIPSNGCGHSLMLLMISREISCEQLEKLGTDDEMEADHA